MEHGFFCFFALTSGQLVIIHLRHIQEFFNCRTGHSTVYSDSLTCLHMREQHSMQSMHCYDLILKTNLH